MKIDLTALDVEDRNILILDGSSIFQLLDRVHVEYSSSMFGEQIFSISGIIVNIDVLNRSITLREGAEYYYIINSDILSIEMLDQKEAIPQHIRNIATLYRAEELLYRLNCALKVEVTSNYLSELLSALKYVKTALWVRNEPRMSGLYTDKTGSNKEYHNYCTRCGQEITDETHIYCHKCGSLLRNRDRDTQEDKHNE